MQATCKCFVYEVSNDRNPVKLARLRATVIVAVIGFTTPALTYQTQELISYRWQKQIQTTFCSFN